MHSCNLDVEICKLSKIEGHADLDIKIRDGKLKEVDLKVMENVRFFNQAVVGMQYSAVPQLVSRICGTCSIAHLTACIEAVEKTLDIVPSRQTVTLRKLTTYSMMIRDHALHLYFFVMPDILGIDSLLDVPEDKHDLIHDALAVKEAGNNLSELVAGRAVHAPYEQVGGFSHEIDEEKIPAAVEGLKKIRPTVLKLIDEFSKCDWEFRRKTNFVALTTDDFSFLEGKIKSTSGMEIEEKDYWDHLHKVVLPYSQATSFDFEGHEYMVGSLARMNLNRESLHANTKRDAEKYLAKFPSDNVYDNNLAQAIEILHAIDHTIEILENTRFQKEEAAKPGRLTGSNAGAIEAPRGTLYYALEIEEGKVKSMKLVIPTAQNLVNMKKNVEQIVSGFCALDSTKEELEKNIVREVSKLIRAYDPCMSCASHFLRVRWK
ncbi:MAG: nickel-dependent hydrogenase large subunit [Candidatus Moranbacteria bacterium]|nr:nickel-dependent hydrogenase large subunit [Candidatus Moranbacteria bacterium]